MDRLNNKGEDHNDIVVIEDEEDEYYEHIYKGIEIIDITTIEDDEEEERTEGKVVVDLTQCGEEKEGGGEEGEEGEYEGDDIYSEKLKKNYELLERLKKRMEASKNETAEDTKPAEITYLKNDAPVDDSYFEEEELKDCLEEEEEEGEAYGTEATCEFCRTVTTNWDRCDDWLCHRIVCGDCVVVCKEERCHKRYCPKEVKEMYLLPCSSCKHRYACEGCVVKCGMCSKVNCNKCRKRCTGCNMMVCDNESKKCWVMCQVCKFKKCKDCVYAPGEMTKGKQVYNYHVCIQCSASGRKLGEEEKEKDTRKAKKAKWGTIY